MSTIYPVITITEAVRQQMATALDNGELQDAQARVASLGRQTGKLSRRRGPQGDSQLVTMCLSMYQEEEAEMLAWLQSLGGQLVGIWNEDGSPYGCSWETYETGETVDVPIYERRLVDTGETDPETGEPIMEWQRVLVETMQEPVMSQRIVGTPIYPIDEQAIIDAAPDRYNDQGQPIGRPTDAQTALDQSPRIFGQARRVIP